MNPHPEPVTTLVRHQLAIRRLAVHTVERPTPRLVRVTLGGAELDGFTSLAPDDYVRVFFPTPGATELVLPQVGEHGVIWPNSGPQPIARHFTPGRFDPVASTLQLDIVLHAAGVASAWATAAKPGQHLGIGGPRESNLVNVDFDAYLLAADETGLPALARWVRELPENVPVSALVEVSDHLDEQELETSTRLAIQWVHRTRDERLQDVIRSLVLPAGRLYIWVAAEASAVQAIRHHLLDERGLDPETLRARGYWKVGIEGDSEQDH